MSKESISRMDSLNSILKLVLTIGAILIGMSGWIVLPEKLDSISTRTAKLEAKSEALSDVVTRLDERLASIQKILERMERISQ